MTAKEDRVDYLWSLWPMLLCPLLMGPIMWLAMRMNRTQDVPPASASDGPGLASPVATGGTGDERLAALRTELEEIGVQQAAIAARIERLSAEVRPAVPAEPVPTEPIHRTS